MKDFKPLFKVENERYDDLDEDSKLAQQWQRWLNGETDREVHEMNRKMFGKGGAFDKFAGDDGMMSLEEGKKMNDVIRQGLSKAIGEDIPAYPKGHFQKIFEAYDKLSPAKPGFSKKDARMGQKIFEFIRDQRISDREMDKFYPMTEYIYDEIDDLPEDNDYRQYFFKSIHEPVDKKIMKAFLDAFDKFDANNDHRLNRHEWNNLNEAAEVEQKKYFKNEGPEWTIGDRDFFWTMSQSVSEGRWNRGDKREGHGNMTKRDFKRLNRIMRKIYEDIEEDSDSDSDDEDHAQAEEKPHLLI